jgi:putative hydrolase of the HAD superfamily
MAMASPSAICFDLGYTLAHHAPSGPELYRRVLEQAGYPFAMATLEAAHRPAREMYTRAVRDGRDFESSMADALEFWMEYNLILLDGLGVPGPHRDALARRIAITAWSPESWMPFPDAVETLDALRRRGIKLAIVSNFVDTLAALCELHQLSRYFDVIVASVEAGAMKPDPRIFHRALNRLGVGAEETWHVGDNYWADVLGARAVGITPVLVDRHSLVRRADCAVVRSLDELLALVDAAPRQAA